jgi:hypothetical protein
MHAVFQWIHDAPSFHNMVSTSVCSSDTSFVMRASVQLTQPSPLPLTFSTRAGDARYSLMPGSAATRVWWLTSRGYCTAGAAWMWVNTHCLVSNIVVTGSQAVRGGGERPAATSQKPLPPKHTSQHIGEERWWAAVKRAGQLSRAVSARHPCGSGGGALHSPVPPASPSATHRGAKLVPKYPQVKVNDVPQAQVGSAQRGADHISATAAVAGQQSFHVGQV